MHGFSHHLERGRWTGSRDVTAQPSESPRTPGRAAALLAASARNADELRCQNPDCTAVLDVTAIPVEYEAILQRLLYTPPSGPKGAATGGPPPARSVAPPLVPLEDFRAAEKLGDNVTFALLVALACEPATDVPLPFCDSCMEATLKARSRAFHDASDDRDSVAHFRDMVESRLQLSALAGSSSGDARAQPEADSDAPPPPPAAHAALTSALSALAAEEAALQEEVATLEAALAEAAAAQAAVDARAAALAALEARWWEEFRATSRAVQASRARMLALRGRNLRFRDLLARLRHLNALSDAFFIWHRGPLVTINGCRLGRIPGHAVDWPEINSALGQTAMLAAVVATRIGFQAHKYRVVPMGSYSHLALAGDEKTKLKLHHDGSLFASSRLQAALKALGAFVGELGDLAAKADASFRLPHPITHGGERVGDLAVAPGGRDAAWTRAMKLLLTDLKWLLAWSSRLPE